MKIRSQLLCLSLANALFVLVLGGSAYFGVLRLTEASQSVAHSHKVLGEINLLMGNLAESTANERAFLISEQESYYQRYRFGIEKVEESMARLPKLVSDNEAQAERVKMVLPIITERLASFETTTELLRKGNKEAAFERVKLGKGAQFMVQIVRQMDELKAEESKLLDHRILDLEHNDESLKRTLLFGTLSAIACVALFNAALARNVVAWVGLLKQAADNIERGRYDTRVPVDTADEFAEIATAFNRLGQSLEVALDTQPLELDEARLTMSRVAQTASHVEEWARTARENAGLSQSSLNAALSSAGEMSLQAPVLVERSSSSLEAATAMNENVSQLQDALSQLSALSGELSIIASTDGGATTNKGVNLKDVASRLRQCSLDAHKFVRRMEADSIKLLAEERDERSSAQKIYISLENVTASLKQCKESIADANSAIANMSELSSKNTTTVAMGRGSLDKLWNDFERRKAIVKSDNGATTSSFSVVSGKTHS